MARRYRPLRSPTDLSVRRAMNTLLEGVYWPKTIQPREFYARRQDDTDGQRGIEQDLVVGAGPDGDMWVLCGRNPSLRFRCAIVGGGQSPRVRNALLLLAEAIRRDNEERPQDECETIVDTLDELSRQARHFHES